MAGPEAGTAGTHPQAVLTTDDRTLANAVRALAMDAVERAASGHPGAPMGMADFATVLFREYLKHNPADPDWFDRDRFVLSNGHGSMLLYALLHLTGYDLPMQELKDFRQLGSKTPGHPEYALTPGVETTTGPLGQGLANAVGMALAEHLLAAEFNRDGHDIVDHRTFVAVGDGCLMEGISHEACSLAGTLGLGKLVALFDDNGISIDGEVAEWCRDDTPGRFLAYGWHVVSDVDGHDPEAVRGALDAAVAETARPSLICLKTEIGRGAPNKAGTAGVHGAPLGKDEITAARAELGWQHGPFEIPADVYAAFDARERGGAQQKDWQRRFDEYATAHPELAAELRRRIDGQLPEALSDRLATLATDTLAEGAKVATRKASGNVLDALAPLVPELVGGSADLSGSNNTRWKDATTITPDAPTGRYLSFGVREFAMTAIATGVSLHGAIRPFVGTFLVFSDYARNAVRLAALMHQPVVLVYTHDSIGLGEDGPTHQPVEHTASLRLVPNLEVWRPADAYETVIAWQAALERRDGPTALLLSRQGLPAQPRTPEAAARTIRGGYVLDEGEAEPALLLVATGSEVALVREAGERLRDAGVATRVVSIPCLERFLAQPRDYRDQVIPPNLDRRVVVEAGASAGWYQIAGLDGLVVGLDRFGESAPADALFAHFGFTPEALTARIREYLG